MSELSEPLTPFDCDLRGLAFMPLDVIRLMDSDLFALTTGEEFKAAVALWCKSWLQIPAASLPDDDRILAHLSGSGSRWKKIKTNALRGWVKCSDGRLYHPVVAEKAVEAFPMRQEYKEKRTSEAERKQREREARRELFDTLRAAGVTAEWNTKTSDLRDMVSRLPSQPVTPPVTPVTEQVTAKTGTGTGTGTGTIKEKKEPPQTPPASERPKEYAFEGKVIRLVETDLARWRKTYHAIPDLIAELVSLDGWLTAQPQERQEKWFHTVSGALNRKHQEILENRKTRHDDGGDLELPIC